MDTAPRNVFLDIRFYREEIPQTAPLLRTVAGLTYGTETTRQEFIRACVSMGFNAGTAGVCWAAGRKVMKEMDDEQ